MELTPSIFIGSKDAKEKIKLFVKEEIQYSILEIQPSKMTSNQNVKWLVSEFARFFKPLEKRINITGGKLVYSPELTIWWEVMIYKGKISFYLVIPDKDDIKESVKRQVMKTWKQCTVREVKEYIPQFDPSITDVNKLALRYNSILSLDTHDPTYSPLESLLNAKHYLKDDDMALLQIGMLPLGEGWNKSAQVKLDSIKKTGTVPRKEGKKLTVKEMLINFGWIVGVVAQELMNLLGDFLIPGWEEDKGFSESFKDQHGDLEDNKKSTLDKSRSEAFKINMHAVARSVDPDRRRSILRALGRGFDPLEGANKLMEQPLEKEKDKAKALKRITDRKMTVKMNGDVMCTLELARIINVPDQKSQIEHYNELSLVTHRGESDIPKEVFVDDGEGILFAEYKDTDDQWKQVFFTGKNKNHLVMPRVFIGEPGTGKTTAAVNFALEAFFRGYGAMAIDAADGKMIQRILDRIPPQLRGKVRIIDLLNTEYPVGLGWNEAFRARNSDIIEEILVEEITAYIEMVSGTELNMKARIWVENAVKAVFTTPDATLLDVENMLNNAEYRNKIIPTITDPELRSDWLMYHETYSKEERASIYDQAFRRLASVMRKKALKNFILQRPKKDENGEYLFDIRKWMDEECLVLVRANETLGENLQTALVSFLIAKFNLAMISREDVSNEDDRKPCFLLLDEPDHYIKGSERWRNMLTRCRKYRCGLVFMFHGWQQLKKTDKDLPDIIRKSGPHYVIFQTDEDNLLELKSVIEPDFHIKDIVKGMPQYHAIIRLKGYGSGGDVLPAFMAKAINAPENRYGQDQNKDGSYKRWDNDDLYGLCATGLGRPKVEVMEEIFRYKRGAEILLTMEIGGTEGEGELNTGQDEEKQETESDKRSLRRKMEYEVSKFLDEQTENGEELDEDLLLEMDRLLDGDEE